MQIYTLEICIKLMIYFRFHRSSELDSDIDDYEDVPENDAENVGRKEMNEEMKPKIRKPPGSTSKKKKK